MGKLIFLDIDGTLAQILAPPTPRVIRAIREARANGHRVFLCTGRNPPIITEDILDIGFDGVVASASRHVEVNGQVLYDSVLPEKTVQECLSVFHALGVYCRLETPEGIYTDPQMEELLRAAAAERDAAIERLRETADAALSASIIQQLKEDLNRL